MTEDQYRQRAYQRAFGDQGADWIPSNGFRANEARIRKLYAYYQMIYNAAPHLFLWPGLARMAGGQVFGSLRLATLLPGSDSSSIPVTLIDTGKAIFDDLAWLFEAYLDNPAGAILLAGAHDLARPARRSYAQALTQIFSGAPAAVADGNRIFAEIEQFNLVQPVFDRLRPPSPEWLFFGRSRAFAGNLHPYHKDFITSFPSSPTRDVTIAADRWEWVTMPGGMWEKWADGYRGSMVGVDGAERARLVNLSLEDLSNGHFGPTDPNLVPPGSQ